MRINYLKTITCISVAASVTLVACHGNSSSSSVAQNSADTLTKATAQQAADQDSETYLLPSPLQIASIFKQSGLTYLPGVTAPFKDGASFNSQFDRALNMGIYSADLSSFILHTEQTN